MQNFSFSQELIDDDEVTARYALKLPATGRQQDIFLARLKTNDQSIIKKQYKKELLLQVNARWFIIRAPEISLQQSGLFQKILPANNNYKLALPFFSNKGLERNTQYHFIVKVTDSSRFVNDLREYDQLPFQSSHNTVFFTLKTRLSFITDTLIYKDYVLFTGLMQQAPKEEMVINEYDNSVNSINLLSSAYPGVNGEGLSVSIKENLFDTVDIDIKGRYRHTPNMSKVVTTHATTMATFIGGGGNSFYTGRGVAPATQLTSSDFANLLPDDNSLYLQFGTSVQNHSYGTLIENFYGAEANAFDESLLENPNLVYIFSAGNSGTLAAHEGQYEGLDGFANITGNFKQAKNVIIVGSVDSFYQVPAVSSKGPAYDGRIKPELVAYGKDGSSGAAAITSGTSLAIQSAYKNMHHDSLPPNALVKAILINSADDVFNPGPDYYSGYGNVDAYKAVRDISSGNYFAGSSKQNSIDSFTIAIPANIKNLKLTLVWHDEPAQPNAFTALVNDLDIELKNRSTGDTFLPWVLNSEPDATSLLEQAQRKRDSLNVVEQITLQQPGAGDYVIYIKGYNLNTTLQPYYLAHEMEVADSFRFITPAGSDHFPPGKKAVVRWNSTYTDATGKLEYSVNKGQSWSVVKNGIAPNDRYAEWQVPDTSAIALMRMTIGNEVYVSDTFDLSLQLAPEVILNCSDSVLISWDGIQGIDDYKILRLGDNYLEEYAVINDTSITLENNTSPYIAIAPVFENGRQGLTSYAFNFNTQGAGCYINNFLADLTNDDEADLYLALGTTVGVDSVQFQQFIYNKWETLETFEPVTTLNLHYLYNGLFNGINTFRAIAWVNASQAISNSASIYYFNNIDFIAKPNPLPRGQNLSILSTTLVPGTLVIYDVQGRKLLQQAITATENLIQTRSLAAGLYYLVIYDDRNEKVFRGKLAVQ